MDNFEGMDLGQLFEAADKIGDKYLSEEEIDERAATLQAILDSALDDGLLDG